MDFLIEREELIGRKTFERYQGREDFLIYRSHNITKENTVNQPFSDNN